MKRKCEKYFISALLIWAIVFAGCASDERSDEEDVSDLECGELDVSKDVFFRDNFCNTDQECAVDEMCGGGLCIEKSIRTYNLIVDQDEWNLMRTEGRYEKMEIPCSLEFNGVTYSDCIVRPRGESSLDYKKLPIRIEFPEDAAHPGYSRKINLRSEYNDRSYLRMILAHETFRSLTKIPSPETRFVNLSVNNISGWGLYVEIERIGGKFLEQNGKNRKNSMYESDGEVELIPTGIGSLVPLENEEMYKKGYVKKTGSDEDDYSDLIRFVEQDIFQAYETENICFIERSVNLEMFVDYLAVMGLIQGKDHIRKNYFFSRQLDDNQEMKWEFYAWDLDLTFGCIYTDEDFIICNKLFTEEDPFFGMRKDDVFVSYPTEGIYNLLIDQTFRNDYLKEKVSERMCQMLSSSFWTETIFSIIDAYEQHILPFVTSDSWDRNENVEDFHTGIMEVREFIEKRTEYLDKLLNCQ